MVDNLIAEQWYGKGPLCTFAMNVNFLRFHLYLMGLICDHLVGYWRGVGMSFGLRINAWLSSDLKTGAVGFEKSYIHERY